MEPFTMTEKLDSLRNAVRFGIEHGKRNLIVELDCLEALFGGNVPVGNNVLPPEEITARLYEVKERCAQFKQHAEKWERLHDARTAELKRTQEILAAHRRFHGKAGCPGRPECYVCAAEEFDIENMGYGSEGREQLEGFDCSAGFAPKQSSKTELEMTADKLSDVWLFLDSYARQEAFTPQMAARILINQGAPGWKGTTKSCTECGNPYPHIEFLDGHIECKSCRADKQSYDDLAASGGIVDAP